MKAPIRTTLVAAVALAAITATAAIAATRTLAEKKQDQMTTQKVESGEKPLNLIEKVGPQKDGAQPREPGELQRKALGDWNKWDPMKGF
jgi:hypothetical protein